MGFEHDARRLHGHDVCGSVGGTARRARRRRRGQASDTNARSGSPPPIDLTLRMRAASWTGLVLSRAFLPVCIPPCSLRPPPHLPRSAPSPSMRLWSSFAPYQSQLRAFPRTLRAGLYGGVPLLTLRRLWGGLEFFLLAGYGSRPESTGWISMVRQRRYQI
ncbi:hypothetical protein C8R45DRAFT_435564 [Mycena sanguinolenta]|nr:hypothetical protein C8R45DRAFT_435564 [Mycena sanguinolenta]